MGNCTGNSVGAVHGLAAARMLFLLGRCHWHYLGTFWVNSISLIFLKFEVKFWDELSKNCHSKLKTNVATGVLLTLFLQVIYMYTILHLHDRLN